MLSMPSSSWRAQVVILSQPLCTFVPLSAQEAAAHKVITDAVHSVRLDDLPESKIAMQILHAGRYAYHPFAVAPSKSRAPIGMFTARELSTSQVQQTVRDYADSAAFAREAGYDGVEIMGSEGYLINEFIAARVNQREDEYGGSYENRIRFPLEIVRAVREKCGPDFIVIFRLSMLDLVDGGSDWEEMWVSSPLASLSLSLSRVSRFSLSSLTSPTASLFFPTSHTVLPSPPVSRRQEPASSTQASAGMKRGFLQ